MSEQIYNYEDLLAFCRRKPAEFDAYIRDLAKAKVEAQQQTELEEKIKRREAAAKAQDEAPEPPTPKTEPSPGDQPAEPEPAPVIVEKTVEAPKPKTQSPFKKVVKPVEASDASLPASTVSADSTETTSPT